MALNKIICTIIFSFAMLNMSGAATVYKWIDEDGQVHYGSRSQNKSAKEIEIQNRYIDSGNSTAPLSAEERVNKQKRFLNALDKENETLEKVKREKEEIETKKITRCNAARAQHSRLERANAMYNLDKKGNRVYLNKKQFELTLKQAKERVKKWCN